MISVLASAASLWYNRVVNKRNIPMSVPVPKQLIILHPDGAVDITPLNGYPATDVIHKAIGGYLETVPYFTTYNGNSCLAFCNEEGKLKGLPYNHPATAAWSKAFGDDVVSRGDHLVGNIAVVVGPIEWLRRM